MNERAKLSRKKAKTPDISYPSLAPKIPRLHIPAHDSNLQSATPAPETVQREISQEQENQENISLKQDSFLGNINYLENISIHRPKKTVQRQEIEEDNQEIEQGEVFQAKLNNSESTGKQEESSPLHKAFQPQGKAMQKTSLNSKVSPVDKSINSQSIQRKEITELVDAISTEMDSGKLSKAQIIKGLKKLDKADIDDTNFPRSLVEFVKKRNGITDFSITDLDTAPDPKFGKKHLSKKWTFRHYTKDKYDSLKSLADLEARGIDASANTNDKDWEELGNQGYIFGLIAVNGEVPKRSWLSNMKYYAEYDLKDLSSVWVSGDMLDENGRATKSYQGTGSVIIAQLSLMLGFIDQNVETAIDDNFLSKLEAKVPPATLGTPVWKDA
ncbi:MAG: hypothetical protein WBA39_05965 [Rivularia sp. (in: cyanobacteria)]